MERAWAADKPPHPAPTMITFFFLVLVVVSSSLLRSILAVLMVECRVDRYCCDNNLHPGLPGWYKDEISNGCDGDDDDDGDGNSDVAAGGGATTTKERQHNGNNESIKIVQSFKRINDCNVHDVLVRRWTLSLLQLLSVILDVGVLKEIVTNIAKVQ